MARFHGKVGFTIFVDDQTTGIADEQVVEKTYFGTVTEHRRNWQSSDMVTDDLTLGNQISITADDFAFKHASAICYCEFMGGLWKVTSVRIARPRIVLSLGGVYNGKRPTESSASSVDNGAESLVQTPSGQ